MATRAPTKPIDADEVLRRMLNTPPTPHKPKTAPAKKTTKGRKKGQP